MWPCSDLTAPLLQRQFFRNKRQLPRSVIWIHLACLAGQFNSCLPPSLMRRCFYSYCDRCGTHCNCCNSNSYNPLQLQGLCNNPHPDLPIHSSSPPIHFLFCSPFGCCKLFFASCLSIILLSCRGNMQTTQSTFHLKDMVSVAHCSC